MAWMVIRVRGGIHARSDILETLRFLHLDRPNHATIVPEAASFRGMLTKVQGYVTWGEAEPATVQRLLRDRGETVEGEGLTEGALPDTVAAATISELSERIVAQGLVRAPGLKPLFRLKAPKGGWRSTKRPFALGGALGYRGRDINQLAQRMIE